MTGSSDRAHQPVLTRQGIGVPPLTGAVAGLYSPGRDDGRSAGALLSCFEGRIS